MKQKKQKLGKLVLNKEVITNLDQVKGGALPIATARGIRCVPPTRAYNNCAYSVDQFFCAPWDLY